ncbi:MAG: carboxypeptidase-like regulatory domain-containing protein, partial [Candidatus Acidiferrales bacterium]
MIERLRNFASAVAWVRELAVAAALMALCATLALPAHAQVTTGSISGTVVDQSGAAVPGATITAINRETHASAAAQSNDSGYFKLGFLAVGSYDVTIDRPSFRSVKISGAAVQVNADNSLGGIKLELGASTATVEVTAAPPLVEADTAQITNTFTDQTVSGFAGVG